MIITASEELLIIKQGFVWNYEIKATPLNYTKTNK